MTSTPRGAVLAAIGFDALTKTVVDAGLAWARRFDLSLHLVNVFEDPIYDFVIPDLAGAATVAPYVTAASEKRLGDRQRALADLLAGLDKKVPVTGEILHGDCVRTIMAEADRRKASLIIVGASPSKDYRCVPRGVSTALSLMHDSSLPVLVVRAGEDVGLNRQRFSILLADDLRDETLEAVRKTYELALRLGKGTRVRHVHVQGDLRDYLRDAWQGTTAGDQEEAVAKLVHKEYEARVARLMERGQPYRQLSEAAGVVIEPDVRSGDVNGALAESAADCGADLVIFGRHRLLRARPFLIGRVPFTAMLDMNKPVLTVAPSSDAVFRGPFPGGPGRG